MKKLLLALLLACGPAFAQPVPATPVQVTQECIRQMSLGICTAIPRRSDLAPGATRLFSGIGRLSAYAYQDYMDLYNDAVPTDPQMCDLALEKMTVDPMGDHAKIARALWTPPEDMKQTESPDAATSKILLAAMGVSAIIAGAAFLAFRKEEKVNT